MPFSSPGYFGAVGNIDRIVGQNAGRGQSGNRVFLGGILAGRNSLASDLVIIGSGSGAGGLIAAQTGTVIVGSGNAPLLVGGAQGPSVIVGFNNLPLQALATNFGHNVFIGSGIATACNGSGGLTQTTCVVIGHGAMGDIGEASPANATWSNSVIIGHNAARGGADFRTISTSVVIGSGAAENFGSGLGSTLSASVLIGYQAGRSLVTGGNTLIGSDCAPSLTGATVGGNVMIGGSNDTQGNVSNNVIVGHSSGISSGGSGNTIVGSDNNKQFASRNIVLGWDADSGMPSGLSDILVIGTQQTGTVRGAMYADMASGNVILGRSEEGINRDMGGVGALQILKLLNGAVGATNPIGGGYFYVSAGALRWKGSAGTDTLLAPA